MKFLKERFVKWFAAATWPVMIAAMGISYNAGRPSLLAFLFLVAGMLMWVYQVLFYFAKKD